MQYFIAPILLLIFSELLGTVTANKIGIKSLKFNAVIGFCLILAVSHVVFFPFVMADVNFKVLYIVAIIEFLVLSIFIYINRKLIKFAFSKKQLVIVLLLIASQVFFRYQNSIGSLWRYDTVTYTDLITGSIYGNGLNDLDRANGFGLGFSGGNSFQSFYKLASVIYFTVNAICNRLHISFFYMTQHTWMYPIILYVLSSEMIVNLIDDFNIKKISTKILILLFFIAFMGNFYWNSEQAYLGNSFRMIITSYTLYYIYNYFKLKDIRYFAMIIIFNYANMACANANSCLVCFLSFMLCVVMNNTKDTLRIVLLGMYLPFINLLFENLSYVPTCINVTIFVTIFLTPFFIFAKQTSNLLNKKIIRVLLGGGVALGLIITSYQVTHNFFDFSAFLDNWSGWSDMSWDYTDFSTVWRSVANVCYFIIMGLFIYKHRGSTFWNLIVFTTLIFFNPFATPIQNEIMHNVFYRNYDIVINYFTLFLGFECLENLEINKSASNLLIICLLIAFSYIGYNQFLYHPPGEGFDKDDDYNELLSMENDEADALLFMKEVAIEEDISGDKIISSIYQIRCELPLVKTLYARSKKFNGLYTDFELYRMFYPDDYYGDPYGFKDVSYDNLYEELENSDYTFIIQSRKKELYDEENDYYYPLTDLLDQYYIPIYQNDTFSIYRIH